MAGALLRDRELAVVRVKEKITSAESALAENGESVSAVKIRLEATTNRPDSGVAADAGAGDVDDADVARTEELTVDLER